MCVDENTSQAFHPVALDKTHAAHVGSQVIYFGRSVADAPASCFRIAIQVQVLCFRKTLIPLVQWFLIHSAYALEASIVEVLHQMATDKPTGTRDEDQPLVRSGFQ